MAEYLKQEEKKQIREFWEEVFDEDTPDFLDYYEAFKLPGNEILAEREGDRIVSMLHRNPYRLALGSGRARCDYIVAVATRADRRHRGLMAGLLKRMAEDGNREKMPLCFLMPAAEAIYLPFGFTDIWDKIIRQRTKETLPEGFSLREVEPSEYERLSALTGEALGKTYDIYALRTPDYYRCLAAGLKSEQGGLFWILKDGEPAGYFSGWPDGRLYEMISWHPALEGGKGGRPSSDPGPAGRTMQFAEPTEEKTMIMARILCLSSFLKGITADERGTVCLHLTDPLVDGNNGSFLWQVSSEGSRIRKTEGPLLQAAAVGEGPDRKGRAGETGKAQGELSCGIDALTAWLCGYASLRELAAAGRISGNEAGFRLGETVRPLLGVHLPEEV